MAAFTSKKLLSVLKVVISLGLAVWLFWYLYRDGFSDTLQRLKNVDYSWVGLSLLIGITAHTIRAYRWKLLLEPTGNYTTVFRTLTALMFGYLVNLAVPRLGEVSRCLALKKSDNIPVTSSLGTVVSERVLDVLSLLIITGLTMAIEFEKLNEFFSSFFTEKLSSPYLNFRNFLLLGTGFAIIVLLLWYLLRSRLRRSTWWYKMRSLGYQTWLGFISITRLENPWAFWLSTLAIWILYYFMSYVVFFAMGPTTHLGWRAGLALLVMGGLAMSAPVQGGIGAFHLLVAGLLIYYEVSREDGLSFAFLLHSSQIVMILLTGLISSVVLFFNTRNPETLNQPEPVKE